MCLWEDAKARNATLDWWKYISRVHYTCGSVINDQCSERAHEFLGLNNAKTKRCVKESFGGSEGRDGSTWGDKSTHNTMIDKEISYWREYGTNIYPSIVINGKTYRGQIEPMSVFNAICSGFTNPPDQCLKTLHLERTVKQTKVVDGDSISVGSIVLIVGALILVNVVIVYFCRRKAKRDMNNEMQM